MDIAAAEDREQFQAKKEVKNHATSTQKSNTQKDQVALVIMRLNISAGAYLPTIPCDEIAW